MTLSRFLRDYLYIPLGGNRHGKVGTYVNLLVTMVLGGFWHGAAGPSSSGAAFTGLFLIARAPAAGPRLTRFSWTKGQAGGARGRGR